MGTYSAPVWSTPPTPTLTPHLPLRHRLLTVISNAQHTHPQWCWYTLWRQAATMASFTKSPHFTRELHSLVLTKDINKNIDTPTHIWRKKTSSPPILTSTAHISWIHYMQLSLHTKQQRLGRSNWRFGEHSVHVVILDFLLKWGQLRQEVGDNCQAGCICQTNYCLGGQTTFLL